ncbi:TonB-dependent receptor PqqU [Aurantivibrio plasticivorans]
MRYIALSLLVPTAVTLAQAGDEYVDEVVTVSKKSTERFDTVGNIGKMDRKSLEMVSALHIQDALLRVPGVNLQQGNGKEYLPSVRSPVLTGAGACGAFLTAQDNIPLRAAGFCNVNELFESYTEVAQQIEVIRGPNTALYGSNALHGVVNVLMPSVGQDDEISIKTEAGSNDYRRNTLDGNIALGDHAITSQLTATHDGGFRDDSGYDEQKLHVKHQYSGDVWTITSAFAASNLNQETAGYITGEDSYKDDDAITTNENPEAYRDAKSYRLYSSFERALSEHRNLVITPYARKTEMDFMMHFLPGNPVEENGQKSLGVTSRLYDSSIADVDWVVGFDAEITDGYLKQTQAAPSFAVFPTGRQYNYRVEALQASPYVDLRWAMTNQLSLNAGLRFESMRYDYDNRMRDGNTQADGSPCAFPCRYTRPADRKDSYNNWSPNLGLKYALTDDIVMYADIAKGYRAPQATEVYRLQGGQQVANIDSEKLESVELGLRGRSTKFRYEVNAYAMEKQNVIFQDSNRQNVDNGETKHVGYELELGVQIVEGLDLSVAANYGDHYYSKSIIVGGVDVKNNQVDTAPKRFGSAQLSWQVVPNLRSELEWVHMGSYFTDPQNDNDYSGHDIANIRAEYQPIPSLNLGLRVLNLTDRRYAERADFTGFSGARYFPGEPRSYYVSAEYRF